MMRQLEVEVIIRKGLGPEYITKNFPYGFDDLPEDTTDFEIKEMAKYQVETYLRNTEDYRAYGKNWEIIDYHFTN